MTVYHDYIEPISGHRIGVRRNLNARPEKNSGISAIYEIYFLKRNGTKGRNALHVKAFKRCRSQSEGQVQEALNDYAREHGWEIAPELIRE